MDKVQRSFRALRETDITLSPTTSWVVASRWSSHCEWKNVLHRLGRGSAALGETWEDKAQEKQSGKNITLAGGRAGVQSARVVQE